MDERQIRWGLSGGVTVLAIAGYFWCGLSISEMVRLVGWPVLAASTAAQVVITGALIWRAIVLRRASGFSRADLRRGGAGRSAQTKRILAVFRWTTVGQAAGVGLAVWLCLRSGAPDLIWPSIGLVTSLHFIPLARVFHVRAYYSTAAVGCAFSLAALAGLNVDYRLAWFGGGMAIVMWLSAWYVLRNAIQIAAAGARQAWAA